MSTWILVVGCAGAAGWLSVPALRHRSGATAGGGAARLRAAAGHAARHRAARAAAWSAAPVALITTVAVLPGALVPALVGGLLSAAAARRWRAARRSRRRDAARDHDVRLLRALAAELRSGQSPTSAILAVARDADATDLAAGLQAAAQTEALGGDPSAVLTGASGRAAALGAAWTVSRRTGAPLAAPVRRIADAAAADLRIAREVDAALASARSSAQLLALLPLAGALLGALSGAGSLQVLVTTGVGQACLLAGVLLDLAGLHWLDRLAARAAR